MAGAASAQAAPIVQIEFIPSINTSTGNTDVSGRLTLECSENAQGDDFVSALVENTTAAEVGSRMSAVGFEWPDGLNLPQFAPGGTSSYFDVLDYDVNVSPGWLGAPGGYDVMITGDSSFEGGSSQGAPAAGQSQTPLLALGNTPFTAEEVCAQLFTFFESSSGPVAIARFQAVGPNGDGSDKVAGSHAPEPATLSLLALGFLLGWRRRAIQ